jgi:hypothetical protein
MVQDSPQMARMAASLNRLIVIRFFMIPPFMPNSS